MIEKRLFSLFAGIFAIIVGLIITSPVFAQGVDDIAENVTNSAEGLPGLITGTLYLLGLLFGVQSIFKSIEHVNNPTQVPIRVPIMRFLAGGALFSVPIVYETMEQTISNGSLGMDISGNIMNDLSGMLGAITGVFGLGGNINGLITNIVSETELLPGIVTAVAYLLGLLLGGIGVVNIKDHVEDPTRMPLKDGVIKLLVGGGMFALPAVFEAMFNTINGAGLGFWGFLAGAANALTFIWSGETQAAECTAAFFGFTATLGDVICNSWLTSSAIPAFLGAISYMLGLVFGVWALVKIKNHVVNPNQTSLWDGISRLIAGGAFFALPAVVTALQMTFEPLVSPLEVTKGISNTTFNEVVTCGVTNSLDEALACFMNDILGPSHVTLNFFSFVAGMILIMVGISRLIKTAQDGPRGPGGMGTIGTFTIGGILLSATTIMRAISGSLFNNNITATYANLSYTTGMTVAETQAAYNVISAVLKFMIVVGMISFVRGLFIMRQVCEGNQQASMMAGVTHILGGALAVNLGPLLNAVQQTLGITAFGVTFGAL